MAAETSGSSPALIHLDLQDGFASDRVVVTANHRVVVDQELTSSPATGMALAGVTAPVEGGRVELTIELPDLAARHGFRFRLDPGAETWIGVSLAGAEIVVAQVSRSFGPA